MRDKKRDIAVRGVPMDSFDNISHEGSEPVDRMISREQEAVVREALGRIPEEYREPLVLFYREEQSVREVATQLELSEEAVRTRLSRARLMLKNEVEMMIETTIGRSKPGKAFTAAVLAGIAGIGVGSSGAALTGSGTGAGIGSGTAVGGSAIMAGLTAKIITAVVVVAIGVGAALTYKQIIKPSFGVEIVQKRGDTQGKSTEGVTEQRGDKTANPSIVEKNKSDVDNGTSPAASTETTATINNTVKFGIHVFTEETKKPIAGANLRVNRGCGCNCEPDNYSTDANGFYLIDFGKKRPDYLSIVVTKAGYVPMMFAWRDKMVETMGNEFTFYLPKGNKIGGVIEDVNSKPIASAKVILSMYADESTGRPWIRIDDYTITTDPNGRWQCDIFPKELSHFSVKLQHPDYANTRIWINDRDYKFEDFYNKKSVLVMKEGALLSGLIVNSQDIPIEGATVFTGEDRFDNDSPKTTT
ncbi:MAG: sigma-70 family RNA polymerase sigma factor, partial [Sedimentisphaerales bacterium]|nr:sigma-70 family RNA polymerase sigma factor [Sedimentisphaerales bacterium]